MSSIAQGPFFSPCTFPTPVHQPLQFRSVCTIFPRVPFLCDLHQLLSHSGSAEIHRAFHKHRKQFTPSTGNESLPSLGIILVRYLAPPLNTDVVYKNRQEYGCLFDRDDECQRIDAEQIQNFVNRPKIFVRLYTSTLYERWFPSAGHCSQPNVLITVLTEGVLNDYRLIPIVKIHSGESKLNALFINIQLETENAILQGLPLHLIIADLIDQVGHALHEWRAMGGAQRLHIIPAWAWQLAAVCFGLVCLAIMVEWYIVRRKLAVKRSPSGIVLTAGRSKTHLMF